jgi:hypothetical protein
VAHYALFNGRDWDGLPAMLADDMRLMQSTYPLRAGAADVGVFFGIYSRSARVRLAPARLDGRDVIAVLLADFGERRHGRGHAVERTAVRQGCRASWWYWREAWRAASGASIISGLLLGFVWRMSKVHRHVLESFQAAVSHIATLPQVSRSARCSRMLRLDRA